MRACQTVRRGKTAGRTRWTRLEILRWHTVLLSEGQRCGIKGVTCPVFSLKSGATSMVAPDWRAPPAKWPEGPWTGPVRLVQWFTLLFEQVTKIKWDNRKKWSNMEDSGIQRKRTAFAVTLNYEEGAHKQIKYD